MVECMPSCEFLLEDRPQKHLERSLERELRLAESERSLRAAQQREAMSSTVAMLRQLVAMAHARRRENESLCADLAAASVALEAGRSAMERLSAALAAAQRERDEALRRAGEAEVLRAGALRERDEARRERDEALRRAAEAEEEGAELRARSEKMERFRRWLAAELRTYKEGSRAADPILHAALGQLSARSLRPEPGPAAPPAPGRGAAREPGLAELHAAARGQQPGTPEPELELHAGTEEQVELFHAQRGAGRWHLFAACAASEAGAGQHAVHVERELVAPHAFELRLRRRSICPACLALVAK
eukprot:tig00001065_g6740.t1